MKLKNNIKILITCDSGAAAGKTTVSKFLSRKLGLKLLTSGLLYRYIAYRLIKANKTTSNITFLKKITKKINLKNLKNLRLYSPVITEYTAEIAKIKIIRILLKNFQKKFASQKRVILEGRDMGILFPHADLKFYFKCSLKIAAKRRFKELKKTNKKITLKNVEKTIKLRNHIDTTRKFSPLRIPRGAVIVDTTNINKKQMFEKVLKIVENKLLLKYGRNYKTR